MRVADELASAEVRDTDDRQRVLPALRRGIASLAASSASSTGTFARCWSHMTPNRSTMPTNSRSSVP